jgi:hypothetical protein
LTDSGVQTVQKVTKGKTVKGKTVIGKTAKGKTVRGKKTGIKMLSDREATEMAMTGEVQRWSSDGSEMEQ